jgi:hypothetical protein
MYLQKVISKKNYFFVGVLKGPSPEPLVRVLAYYLVSNKTMAITLICGTKIWFSFCVLQE